MLTAEARRAIRNRSPRVLRNAVVRLRTVIGGPPIEQAVARPYVFEPSPVSRARMTLVMPSLDPRDAFGGVSTGLRCFFGIAAEMERHGPIDLRVIAEDIDPATSQDLCFAAARSAGVSTDQVVVTGRVAPGAPVDVRAHEVFTTYNWWTTLNTVPLTLAQAAHHRHARTPVLYLVQDYEPGFYPFSTAHMYARDALGSAAPTWALFNTGMLRDYTLAQGHRFDRVFTFEPELDPTLKSCLAARAEAERQRRVVVYGRPTVDRNCFSALVAGLKVWADQADRAWDVVSVGTEHADIDLAPGITLRSLGKLTLDGYADVLATSLVGVSLMASPHPSYPPLEMAMSGLRTVTNAYANKDLSGRLPGLVSIPDLQSSTIAEALHGACRSALRDGPCPQSLDGTLTSAVGDPFASIASALRPTMSM